MSAVKIDSAGKVCTVERVPSSHVHVHLVLPNGAQILSEVPVDGLTTVAQVHPVAFMPPLNTYLVPADAIITCDVAALQQMLRCPQTPAVSLKEPMIRVRTDDDDESAVDEEDDLADWAANDGEEDDEGEEAEDDEDLDVDEVEEVDAEVRVALDEPGDADDG